jgi:carbonic anhydrase
MPRIKELLSSNKRWAARIRSEDPNFFEQLSRQQAPKFLWIGCSDSRVPATQIVDLPPGEIFVHRNVANVIVHTDLNALSVIQFAVEVLRVERVLVVGHYGCSGVSAVLKKERLGLIDNWLRHVEDVASLHRAVLDPSLPFERRHARLCELNAIEQAMHVCATTIVQEAWQRGQKLHVHAWVYGLDDGRIHDLGLDVHGMDSMPLSYARALDTLTRTWTREDAA